MPPILTALIEDLPTELIELVLGFAASIDTPTALAVCATNRLGRKAGMPVLYHTLDIRCEEKDMYERRDEAQVDLALARRINAGLRKWSLLCRTLLESRTLARYVRTLDAYLDDAYDSKVVDFQASRSLHHTALLKMVDDELMSICVNRDYIWNWLQTQQDRAQIATRHEDGAGAMFADKAPRVFGPDVYLGVLILACPHVRLLSMSGPSTSMLRPINELASALQRKRIRSDGLDWIAERGFGGFSSMTEVAFDGINFEGTGTDSVHCIAQVLRWPSIKKMTITDFCGDWVTRSNFGRAYQSTLTSLHVLDAMVDVTELVVLLRPCRQLKTFAVSWSNVCDVYRETGWRLLAATLVERNPDLEDLSIDVAHIGDLRAVCAEDPSAPLGQTQRDRYMKVNNMGMGSLIALKRLRRLSVPGFTFFGAFDDVEERDHDWILAEMLPSSLQELDIFCDSVKFNKEDMALLGAAGTENLIRMTIWNCVRTKRYSRQLSVDDLAD